MADTLQRVRVASPELAALIQRVNSWHELLVVLEPRGSGSPACRGGAVCARCQRFPRFHVHRAGLRGRSWLLCVELRR